MTRDRQIELIVDHLLLMGTDVDRLTGAAATHNRLNRTDVRALQLLREDGLTAGDLARALHITSGATTRVIDSLVAAGNAVRTPDPSDRRRVLVRLTPAAVLMVGRTFERLRADARSLLGAYGDEELETLARFVADVRSLVRSHSTRLSRPGDR
jgi:DNA-binding MarR family transcriptional regulator